MRHEPRCAAVCDALPAHSAANASEARAPAVRCVRPRIPRSVEQALAARASATHTGPAPSMPLLTFAGARHHARGRHGRAPRAPRAARHAATRAPQSRRHPRRAACSARISSTASGDVGSACGRALSSRGSIASSTASPSTAWTRYARAPGPRRDDLGQPRAAEQQAGAVVDRPARRDVARRDRGEEDRAALRLAVVVDRVRAGQEAEPARERRAADRLRHAPLEPAHRPGAETRRGRCPPATPRAGSRRARARARARAG